MAEDKYLKYIPLIWAAAKSLDKSFLAEDFIYHMNEISLLDYQVDEYMEAVVREQFAGRLVEVRIVVDEIFQD